MPRPRERDVDLSTPRHGERLADVTVTPLPDPEGTLVITLAGAQPGPAHGPPTDGARRGALHARHGGGAGA